MSNDITSKYANELDSTIKAMCTPGKGLLAADESTGTIGKRFESIKLENNEKHRQQYRQLLFSVSKEASQYISGVILYEETLFQNDESGKPFVQTLTENGIVPGIKVDTGLVNMPGIKDQVTQGIDDLHKRVDKFYKQGARFAKWRAAYQIAENQPSWRAIETQANLLARYAAICQFGGLVPIVEPEVLVTEGNHSLQKSYDVTNHVLQETFHHLFKQGVNLERMILKPNMILAGSKHDKKASHTEVAQETVSVLKKTVPSTVPGIMFLSGGQEEDESAYNLNEINKVDTVKPWYLSFSYGRALQHSCIATWKGDQNNVKQAQDVYLKKAKNCSLAALGKLKNCE